MREIVQLTAAFKRQLKLQGRTYRDLAAHLGLSEQSVKRMFALRSFDLQRAVDICNYLGFTLSELTREADDLAMRLHTLSVAQESELVANRHLLLVAVLTLNHWALSDITDAYQFSEAECISHLAQLDRLKLITLLPGNRIRLNVSRDFDWLVNGPIEQYFNRIALSDFLNGDFKRENRMQTFSHGMLSEQAIATMQAELQLLRRKFADLHESSLKVPLAKRHGCGMLLALRDWEPGEFATLRR